LESSAAQVIARCVQLDADGRVISHASDADVRSEYVKYFGGEEDLTFKYMLLGAPTWQNFVDRAYNRCVIVGETDFENYYINELVEDRGDHYIISFDGSLPLKFGSNNRNINFRGTCFYFGKSAEANDSSVGLVVNKLTRRVEFDWVDNTHICIDASDINTRNVNEYDEIDLKVTAQLEVPEENRQAFQAIVDTLWQADGTMWDPLVEGGRIDSWRMDSEDAWIGGKVIEAINDAWCKLACWNVKKCLSTRGGLLWLVDPARAPESGARLIQFLKGEPSVATLLDT
jgi:hypothetical protein